MSRDSLRKKLIGLSKEQLAEALLKLAEEQEPAALSVERLTSDSEGNITRFKERLKKLKASKRFYGYWAASELANELESILEDLQVSKCDPKTGLDLIKRFFECDHHFFEHCDDSGGFVG